MRCNAWTQMRGLNNRSVLERSMKLILRQRLSSAMGDTRRTTKRLYRQTAALLRRVLWALQWLEPNLDELETLRSARSDEHRTKRIYPNGTRRGPFKSPTGMRGPLQLGNYAVPVLINLVPLVANLPKEAIDLTPELRNYWRLDGKAL